ncbi:hypothetical protein [Paenibacillus motobuensis]|uniref:Copper amine oxidase-like N-terminal domain-containing protein n=1 Tax=Paenibacillus motobuensis TaxID=295324 RepID=A0ABN0YJT6_9BACL
MKKGISAIIVGTLLLGSLTAVASAATNSLIGKKVQGVIAVTVNGKAVKDAVIIDGVTYAPVRSFSEAAGYSLKNEGGTVKLTAEEDQLVEKIKTDDRINTLKRNIATWEASLDGPNEAVKRAKASIAEMNAWNAKAGKDDPKMDTSGAEEQLAKAQAEIAELQAKIDAANAEISQLQAK